MKRFILLSYLILIIAMPTMAQRVTDQLDRGLIALPAQAGGNLVSWRLLGEEYYDVTYNVYRNGEKIAENLSVSNYRDAQGNSQSSYTVAAVVRGVEQPQCAAVQTWSQSYKLINLQHEGIRSTLVPNDACCADVDGDGELEILMKFDNWSEIEQSYPKYGPVVNGVTTKEYSIFEVFKLDGTRLWWVNCGPNMGDFQNNEQNIVAYDWDCDGKAEALFRAADGTTIHTASGETITIGNASKNFRGATGGGTNWFMHSGAEYLVYCNGATGEVYQQMAYPLPRLEASENPNNLESGTDYDNLVNKYWGDGYGHRSSKYFFGAPYLDGHKPSIFLARGIYTQIKMCAFDVNPETHQLTKRWDWRQNAGGYWMWQGFHNFGVADVDEDGRDEIVYGSMVIDDCGKGLSTTGFGHGDAQHCSDFNPYTKGLEIYTCNEDQPGNNYRNATTSKIYHRYNSSNDDGRAMMGNFSDNLPGSLGCSAREGAISSVTYAAVDGFNSTGINTNFRIYWDGDLCSETFNYLNGKNTEGCIAKYGSWSPIYTCEGSMTNNDTKGTPCYQGDILGDWREEIIMRDADNNVRIYSTPVATTYRIPTLWSDHQYRNAMVWQMCGYNQPPHLSYFLGKMEGITMAPPPLTMTGKVEVANGATVDATYNDKHAIVCENNNTTVALAEGASPYIMTFNVPSWVEGTAGTNYTAKEATINYKYYSCTVSAGSLAGSARLVKQGDGILNLPATEFTHTGESKVWAGTLNFDGKMLNSDLWLNRFAVLNSNGGEFKSISAQYATEIRPGGENSVGTITADSLCLDFGSRVVIDIDGESCDKLMLRALKLVKKNGIWETAGPTYIQPVLEVHAADLQPGEYVIGQCSKLYGSISDIKIEGVSLKSSLKLQGGKIILVVTATRSATTVYWTGAYGPTWDYATSNNFVMEESGQGTPELFVNGDKVVFGDNAQSYTVSVTGELSVDTMKFVANNHDYVLNGNGSVVAGALVKEGKGKLTISNLNSYAGGNYLRGGVLAVTALSNSINETGALGKVTTSSARFTIENGATLQTSGTLTNGSVMRMNGEQGGVIQNTGTLTQDALLYGTTLEKKGNGVLALKQSNTNLKRLVIAEGTVTSGGNKAAQVVELKGGTLTDQVATSHTIHIEENKSGIWNTANRCTYSNALTGKGKITIYCATEKGTNYYATRTPLALNLTDFEGTIVPQAVYAADGRFTLSSSSGSDKCTFNIPAGIIVQNEGKTFAIGKVVGDGALGGGCTFSNSASAGVNTWRLGNENDFTFPGIVESNARVEKVGTGAMTATGVWTTTGTITVKEGELRVSGKNVSLGSGAITVAAGATFCGSISGNAVIKNTITVNGTLRPGTSTTMPLGTLVFNNQNITVNSTGTLRFVVQKASTSESVMSGNCIKKIGKLTLKGKLQIGLYNYTPKVGDEIRLWSEVGSFAGTPTIETEGMNVEYDTSRLAEGVLVVTSATDIDELTDGYDADDAIYTLGGVRVESEENIPQGVYVRNGKKIIVK